MCTTYLGDVLAAKRGDESASPREAPHCTLLTAEQCEATDDMAGIDSAAEMRNTLIRAEYIARVRRFDSTFGALT